MLRGAVGKRRRLESEKVRRIESEKVRRRESEKVTPVKYATLLLPQI
jgi:hypothetical protein